jgi:LPXTG-motif cell wall-anchored protein
MNNGQFAFAIIASCGNPVMATPVKTPMKKQVVVSPTVRPPQAPTQTQTQSQTVNVSSPAVATPAVQSASTTTPAAVLPNTGAGSVASIFGGATLFGTLSHWLFTRRRII